MPIDITERTICSELEKHYSGIVFDRKYSKDIKNSILLFIKSELKSHLIKSNLSDLDSFEEGLKFLNNIAYLDNTSFSFISIDFLSEKFFNKHKSEILSSINPICYKTNLVPDCFKNKKYIDNSVHFFLYSSFFILTEKLYHKTDYGMKTTNISFDFNNIVLEYLKNDLPEDFKNLSFKDIEYALSLGKEFFNHNFNNNHVPFRNTMSNRLMFDNISSIVDYITLDNSSVDIESNAFRTICKSELPHVCTNRTVIINLFLFILNNLDYSKIIDKFFYSKLNFYLK